MQRFRILLDEVITMKQDNLRVGFANVQQICFLHELSLNEMILVGDIDLVTMFFPKKGKRLQMILLFKHSFKFVLLFLCATCFREFQGEHYYWQDQLKDNILYKWQ